MVSRSELDMKLIKNEYKKNYGKALYQDILVSKHLIQDNDFKPVLCVMNSSFLLYTYGYSKYNIDGKDLLYLLTFLFCFSPFFDFGILKHVLLRRSF